MVNKIKEILIKLGISTKESITPFYPRTRDREDVAVLKCNQSGVILLSRTDHLDPAYYENLPATDYWEVPTRKAAVLLRATDSQRRYNQFKDIIANKKWVDVGAGCGAMLDIFSPIAKEVMGVEPQNQIRKELEKAGYKTFRIINELPDNDFEVVTLFHVFEHLSDPLETLAAIKERMIKGGKLIIEVPNARDLLLEFFNLEAFKAFTFWSEHLILHTRQSLEIFLKSVGFKNITIQGYQRYPLANHFYWLINGKPGGHEKWSFLNTPELEKAYLEILDHNDYTDTLIAVAEN